MIKNNKLLIDQDCPMCKIYGHCFTKLNLIDQATVTSYQTIDDLSSLEIDMNRAKTEIALYDKKTGQTLYGLDSIIKIIGQEKQWILKLFHYPIIFKPLNFLYKLISYNRKVLYPSGINNSIARMCIPSFNKRYRWTYIVLVAFLTALVVNQYTFHLFAKLNWQHSIYTELLVCFGQVVWQGTVASLLIKSKRLDYLGNMSTVSLIGALLLLPLLAFAHFCNLSIWILLGYFTLVIGTMFFEHLRRCHLLKLTTWMTASWVIFRFTALILIIISIKTL